MASNALLRVLTASSLCAFTVNATAGVKELRVLQNFSNSKSISSISTTNADATWVSTSNNDGEVFIKLHSKEHHKSVFKIEAKEPWDLSELDDFALALDIQNDDDSSLFIYVKVFDGKGQTHIRSVPVSAKSKNTYYIELKGADLQTDTGLRANPQNWETNYVPMIWRSGAKNLDLSQVTGVSIEINTQVKDRSLTIDDVRLIAPTTLDENYLVDLVDKYGQNSNVDYAQKISSDKELREVSDKELAGLRKTPLPERSRFGGWKDGPKLNATGYFRTEKVDGKWSLVDPDGYLFFSHGLANVRMANTTTITGYDFDHSKIKERSADDLTPEDSLGLNRVPDAAIPTRKIVSPLRAKMFSSLPEYDSIMGQYYGYRRSTHTGPLERGESYSFYQANLERRYGEQGDQKSIEKWRDVTVDRMLTWGFPSFGNWIDPMFYQLNRYPYFANGWIIGDFKTVSTGNDYWSPLPDPFDPLFKERADATVKQIAAEVQGNPWCIGVFVDNEKSWGLMGSVKTHYAIVLNTLERANSDSPSKTEFAKIAKDKYKTIEAFNKAWGLNVASWEEFDQGISVTEFSETAVSDLAVMLEHYASEYFKIVAGKVDEYMPNHMYMGVRFASFGMTPEIRAAAAKYSDVMSYNAYSESIHPASWGFLKDIDKPSIIGEFHMGASDTGLFNPGLVIGTDQTDRARLYTQYMESVLENPYFVGAHWFQYIDSPVTGRSYDGENYNIGFVSVTDVPYEEMVEAAKAFNKKIYTQRYGRTK